MPNQDDLFDEIRSSAAQQAGGTPVGNVMGVGWVPNSKRQPQNAQAEGANASINGNAGMPRIAGVAGVNGLAGMPTLGGLNALGLVDGSGHGVTVTMPGAGGHVLTVALSALTGAGIGGAASASWRGAAIGASSNLALLGIVNASFGKGFTGVGGRVAYGILGAFGLSAAVWLMVKRHRGR